MKKTLIAAFVVCASFTACEDHYRYYCQNPDNFSKPQCQKPKCQFTQTCPEYLVAPVLEKLTNVQAPVQPASEAASDSR